MVAEAGLSIDLRRPRRADGACSAATGWPRAARSPSCSSVQWASRASPPNMCVPSSATAPASPSTRSPIPPSPANRPKWPLPMPARATGEGMRADIILGSVCRAAPALHLLRLAADAGGPERAIEGARPAIHFRRKPRGQEHFAAGARPGWKPRCSPLMTPCWPPAAVPTLGPSIAEQALLRSRRPGQAGLNGAEDNSAGRETAARPRRACGDRAEGDVARCGSRRSRHYPPSWRHLQAEARRRACAAAPPCRHQAPGPLPCAASCRLRFRLGDVEAPAPAPQPCARIHCPARRWQRAGVSGSSWVSSARARSRRRAGHRRDRSSPSPAGRSGCTWWRQRERLFCRSPWRGRSASPPSWSSALVARRCCLQPD